MAVQTELEILTYIETVLNSYFSTKYGGDNVIQVFIDPDVEYNLVDSSDVSTPVLLLELDELIVTQHATVGYIIASELFFTLSLLVLKSNRAFTVYKQEVQDYLEDIKTAFLEETNRKFDITEIAFSDFFLEDIDASGAIMGIKVYPQQYDYVVT